MDLKVNRQSELPLRLQFKAQVKHRIRAGQRGRGTFVAGRSVQEV